MHGVILGINLCNYTTDLKAGDLVVIDDGCNDFIMLEKIDPRYGKQPDDSDTPYKYFVRSKPGGKLMNYARTEISLANLAFFDYEAYYTNGKLILLGAISNDDLNHIKGKFAMESEIPFSKFNKIKIDNFINLDFEGEIISEKVTINNNKKEIIKFFKINKPK